MSPKGISFFYCASDTNIVIEEIKNKDTKSIGLISLKPRFNLNIVDFSKIRRSSPFDKTNRNFRRAIVFLIEFIDEINKPIGTDDGEHLEYLPTQVIAEYIKSKFMTKITGIKYKSNSYDGHNFAFFCNQENYKKYFQPYSKVQNIIL